MTGGMLRGFCALCDAPNWLAAESVHASRAAPLAQHGASNLDATVNRQEKAANEAGCEQARFLSGRTHGQAMGMRAQIRAQPGAPGTQKVQPPP
jgi:hypothetical protein